MGHDFLQSVPARPLSNLVVRVSIIVRVRVDVRVMVKLLGSD